MSSTNVHSSNYVAGALVIPTERGVEIPPKKAKKGPTREDVIFGDNIEIPVEDSVLDKSGKLVDKNGNLVAQFDKKKVQDLEKQRTTRAKLKGILTQKSAGQEK